MLSVRYNDRGFIRTQFLVYTPAMTQNPFSSGALNYTFTQRLLTMATAGTYYIRWTRPNGYQILPPYGDLPNDPWFPSGIQHQPLGTRMGATAVQPATNGNLRTDQDLR